MPQCFICNAYINNANDSIHCIHCKWWACYDCTGCGCKNTEDLIEEVNKMRIRLDILEDDIKRPFKFVYDLFSSN